MRLKKINTILLKGSMAWLLLVFACKKSEPILITTEDYHRAVDKVSEIIVHDIFSPPVASRIFVYPNIAAYEILSQADEAYVSLSGQVKDLAPIPIVEPNTKVNLPLSALMAHMELSKELIFSEDKMLSYRDSLYGVWSSKNEVEFEASRDYSLLVVQHIKDWMDKDNYKQTRTMPKFTVNMDEPHRWQPTPPAYMDGIEPHWNKIRTFVLDSASQFVPAPPPPFSLKKGSPFYEELMEVYEVSKDLEEKGDDSEEIEIAQFWDCNPYVSTTKGHLMFAIKKITPGAHWIGITKIACRQSGADFIETIHAYTKVSIALADAFISCWDEKYRSSLIRPETLINAHIDENWLPVLQTPPFPEYTSGHSVISTAAAVVLTGIFGDSFAFDDDTELPYGLPIRSFSSFREASDEAAVSRLYGGIHYRAAIEQGVVQGEQVGDYVVEKLKMRTSQ